MHLSDQQVSLNGIPNSFQIYLELCEIAGAECLLSRILVTLNEGRGH